MVVSSHSLAACLPCVAGLESPGPGVYDLFNYNTLYSRQQPKSKADGSFIFASRTDRFGRKPAFGAVVSHLGLVSSCILLCEFLPTKCLLTSFPFVLLQRNTMRPRTVGWGKYGTWGSQSRMGMIDFLKHVGAAGDTPGECVQCPRPSTSCSPCPSPTPALIAPDPGSYDPYPTLPPPPPNTNKRFANSTVRWRQGAL